MTGKQHPTEKLGRNPKVEGSTETPQTETKPQAKPDQPGFADKLMRLPSRTYRRFRKLNKNVQLAAVLGAILVVVGVTALAMSTSESPVEFANEETPGEIEESAPISADISFKEGTLQSQDTEGTWTDITTEFELKEGALLRTVGASSRAVITFGDGSELRLDANSEVELVTVTEGRIVIRHVSGYTFNRVTTKEDRDYIVESSEAQYQAVGTAFKTAASGDEQAVEVYHKTVHETKTNKMPSEGEKLIVESTVKPSDNNTIQKLDIEAVKQDAFIQWNRGLELANESFKDQLGFLKDFDAPELSITDPAENSTILLEPSAPEGTIEISGKTERGAILTVQSKSEGGSQPVNVSVDSDGNFKTPVLSAPLGGSVFSFVVKDRAGNTVEQSVRYTFQRKSKPVTSSDSISLTAAEEGDKLKLSWTLSGSLKAPDGVKVVYSKSPQPTYGTDTSKLIKDSNTHTIKISEELEDDSTYYFRVCIYDADTSECGPYSNQIEFDT